MREASTIDESLQQAFPFSSIYIGANVLYMCFLSRRRCNRDMGKERERNMMDKRERKKVHTANREWL
jgi:hypothetical protein